MRSPAAAFDLRAALTEEIRAALGELEQQPVKAKAIHRCRVHIKRARALARVGRACAPGLSLVFNESARTIMRGLAGGRDLAVLAQRARDIAAKARGKDAAVLLKVADALDAAQFSQAPVDLDQVRADLRDLFALAQVWPEASGRQIQKGAKRIVRRARRARRRGFRAQAPAPRHEWRKREKDRLYAALLIEREWPEGQKRRRKQSARLAEVLGMERDTLLLLDRLAHDDELAGNARTTARAIRAIEAARSRLSRRADRLGLRVHAGGA